MNRPTIAEEPKTQTAQPTDCPLVPTSAAVPTAPITLPLVPAIPIAPARIMSSELAGVGTLDLLSEAQAAKLRDCEARIQNASLAFVEIGLALATIKEEELNREGFDSFESYCRVKWGFQLSKVYTWITAAKLFISLSKLPDVPKPDHQTQLRPLFGLAPSHARLAWQCAVALSGGRRTTERMVKSAVQQLQLVPAEPPCPRNKEGEQRRVVTEAVAVILVLVHQKAAYEVLTERIEELDHQIRPLLAPSRLKA
jgi:hypothetical protein